MCVFTHMHAHNVKAGRVLFGKRKRNSRTEEEGNEMITEFK